MLGVVQLDQRLKTERLINRILLRVEITSGVSKLEGFNYKKVKLEQTQHNLGKRAGGVKKRMEWAHPGHEEYSN